MLRQRVKSIGIGLTDRVEGPYDLQIHRIWATNGMSEDEIDEEKRICGPNALPVDEGVRTGWSASSQPAHKGDQELDNAEKKKPEAKTKGLQGLRSEWDE